jgi:plasmid stabilization system protein ParE
MASYILSRDAEQDLREIVRYTRAKWGLQQVAVYHEKLRTRFEKIGCGEVIKKAFSDNLPDIYVTRAEKHFVFYLTPPDSTRLQTHYPCCVA